jgi:hypothetical protein
MTCGQMAYPQEYPGSEDPTHVARSNQHHALMLD